MKSLQFKAVCATVLLALSSTAAQASWIQTATASIGNQNPATIAGWIADVADLATLPLLMPSTASLPGSLDSYGGATLTGIGSGAQWLTLHYGNFAGANNVTVLFRCDGRPGCDSFTPTVVNGVSNYRIFGVPTNVSVPEPVTLGLLGLGLAGLGFSRRRRG